MNDVSKKINKNLRKKIGKNRAQKTVAPTTHAVNPAREKKLIEEARKAEIDKNARLEEYNKHVDYSKTVQRQKSDKQDEDERELVSNRVNHKRVIVADVAAQLQHDYDVATDDSKGILDDLGQGHVIDQIEAEAHNLGSTAKSLKQQFQPKIDSIKATTAKVEKKENDLMLETIKEDIPEPEEETEDDDDMSPLSSKKRRYG